MSKKTSFNRDSLTKDSKYDSIAAEESLQSAMHLLGNNGPQLRSITPPHPSPPSLTRGSNLFSTLRGNSLPKEAASPSGSQQGRLLTSDGNILDDELSINSVTTPAAKGSSNGGSATTSYSQAVMQTWVPPVSYSSKSKVPVPDVGAIPYPASSSSRRQAGHGARRGGGNSSSTIDGNFANSLIEEFLPLPFQHQLQQRPGSKGPSSKLSLSPVNGRPGSSEDLRKMSKVTSAGGLKAGERKRQDSIGAVPLPVGEFALRHVATKESAQVLKSLGE